MFCYQCEQTSKGQGCTRVGVCGKQPTTSALQDLLLYALKGLAQVATVARDRGVLDPAVDRFVSEAAFATLTNVNFDDERFVYLIRECVRFRNQLQAQVGEEVFGDATQFEPAADVEGMVGQGVAHGILACDDLDQDVRSARELLIYGIKGLAAYADHARILGQTDELVDRFITRALAATLDSKRGVEDYLALALECGEVNLRAMELLDQGNTDRYGHPVPTEVPLGVRKGKAILVSGHDLRDLELILRQSEGTGIDVYTHGEMLPCHGYPELKKYPHFYGHYGTAWQNQAREFQAFPGAIVMTTNCIQEPRPDVMNRIFTTGMVGWPGVAHIADKDFAPVIEKALELPGFEEDVPGKTVMVGFGRQAVLGVAPTVIDAVKQGVIRHFFLVGGCDGARPGRNYYTEFVEKVPEDCVVLTLACGKFRFFDRDMGQIGGIPRLLDVGQCNDAYSAIKIATGLADAFGCDVNALPLSMILSWYEQKACVILLTLLHLGIKDIRLGPTLPAFITPAILDVLVKGFNLMPITTAEQDLAAILGEPVTASA